MTMMRLRSATATTPASRTSENKADTMRSPPSISSTKGAQMKKRPSAIKSCTVEKRRNLKGANIGFVECLGWVASFIQFSASVYYKLEAPCHNGRDAPADFRVSPLSDLSDAVTCVGCSITVPARPWVPKLLRHLPTHSTPSSSPDTSRRPGDLLWRASCRRGAVDRPGTLWVHRRMPGCGPGQERRNTFSCLFSSWSRCQPEDFGAFAFGRPFWE